VRSSIARSYPGGVGTDYIAAYIFHSSYLLWLTKRCPPPGLSTREKNLWALGECFGPRWAAPYVPSFTYVPTRRNVFLRRLWDALWTFALIRALEMSGSYLAYEDYHAPHGLFRRIHDVTPREILLRVYFMIIGSAIPYCGLRLAHSLATCFALACGDDPKRWPPLFGSLGEAYTVRRYFS